MINRACFNDPPSEAILGRLTFTSFVGRNYLIDTIGAILDNSYLLNQAYALWPTESSLEGSTYLLIDKSKCTEEWLAFYSKQFLHN